MKRFFAVLVLFCAMLFFVSCGETNSTVTTTTVVNDDDEDTNDGEDADVNDGDVDDTADDTGDTVDDTSDTTEPDDSDTEESGKKQGELYGRCYPNKTCNEGLICDEENDTCIKDPGHTDDTDSTEPDEDPDTTPDNDTDTDTSDTAPDHDTDTDSGDTQPLEGTENHTISGFYQIGSAVSGIEAALYECGKTDKIASANTDAKGAFSFKADISATKTYCVKAGDFASCFKGLSDHTANISEITTAAYLLDKNCADLRKSETKIRKYAKLGTGEWLGELDYSKLSGIAEGFKLLASFIGSSNAKTLSEKIAEDAKKDAPEFAKLFNGFRALADKAEVIIGERADNSANFSLEGGSTKVAPGFKINWTLQNKTAEAATYKFSSQTPGEYTARAKLTEDGGDPIMLSNDSATVLFLKRKNGGTVYVSDTSKNISFRIDDGIYGVIPKGTVVKKNGSKINSISYDVLAAGGNQVSRLKFYPEGAVFEGDTMYFVHELGTVFGGDPIMLSATRTNADGSVDVMNSAAGDPIMMAAAGDPIMTTAAGDPIMQAAAGDPIMNSAAGDPIMTAAAGDPIMTSAAGDPIMTSAAGDPIMNAAAGDPIMTSAAGDPIMANAAGDPIMMGTSSSAMISQTGHYSTFTVEAASLPVSVETLVKRWCDTGSFYDGYSPIEFIKEGVKANKPESTLLPYLDCEKFADLGNDLYELMNKPVGFQRNLNLFENLFFVSEFYKRMNAKRENGAFAAVKNGLELRSAIAALYTATTSYNRSTTAADLFDPSMIPLTYSGVTPEDYTLEASAAFAGSMEAAYRYAATKKEMMIFANYITTSSKGPDFNNVSSVLNPDQLVCAWFNPDTPAQNCNKVYTINEAGHVTLGGTEVSAAEANAIFTKYFMPMNSRLSDSEKLDLFRTFYLALKYAGTIFYNGTEVEELNGRLLKTAYLVFDGIDGNAKAVSIVDSFDASAHTVRVLDDGNDMVTRPYLTKLSALTDKISLKVAASSADVEKVLINIEGKEFEKVQENTRTYYKQTGDLKEKSIVLTPGTLNNGEKALKELLGSENVDELGSITGKMTIVANSKISGKTYSTQKTYEFFVNSDSDGVNSKEVPADLEIFVHDSEGHTIHADANPMIIMNPGNKVYYPVDGVVSIENLTPAAYTVDAYADGYYAKSTSVNVPAGADFSVEIKLDKELTSTADASLELSVTIDTAKHPSKVYIQIYNDYMELVANEAAKFNNETDTYNKVNIEISSGRYTLLAVGEDLYNYLEAITLYAGTNKKEIKVVAKNACGNGIVDSAEECEPSLAVPVSCGTIYPASTYPEKTAVCDPDTCTFDKHECGKAADCGDGIIDAPSEGCDGGSKACAEIAGLGDSGSMGSAPCASDCSGYVTANNCTRKSAPCGNLPANAQWNDGEGTFAQTYDGTDWIPATQNAEFGTTKDECTFSCTKGYKWNGTSCEQYPLSLGLICTGESGCFDTENETECPAYGEALFGQDAQYAENGFCTKHDFATSGSGEKKIVTDSYTHYDWTAATSENAMNWDAADEYCSGINDIISGSTAVWRIPGPAELLTIVNSGTASPALVEKFTAYGHTFWAKEDAKVSGNAWRIDETGALASVAKTESHHVICVRVHDYAPVQNRFTAENETVKDKESGLMWQKQPVASRTWTEALNYCEEVSTADKFDWRLPNRNELASLVNYEKANGAVSDFPAIAAKGFWTSTTDIASAANAWTVDFADGSIKSANKADTKYIICVRNDDPCFGSECPNACGFDQCKNMDNSTGLCTADGYDFTCGCKSGFNWNHAKCLLDTTRYIACTGLPENAVWNTVFGISQTYDGNKWYPSEVGTFNKISSNVECRFVCATNYKWDADEEKCLPVSRLADCSEKKPYSEWNVVSRISQTWDGEKWEPSAESEYNTESSEEGCRFICREHYIWNAEDNICEGEKRLNEPCTGLPANAHWWNESATITQTWTNGGWAPSAVGTHSTDGEENRCFFACDTNYEWNDTSCVAKTKTGQNCTGLPDNAEWNGNTSITQTWNGSEWFPTTAGTYNPEANQAYCRYKCLANFTWNGTECVGSTRIESCTGLIANTQWNTVSSIIQTWTKTGENTYSWLPSNVGTYGAETTEECHFKCQEHYEWQNNECKPVTTAGNVCTGLPANAQWVGSTTVEQTWNGSEWTPSTEGHHESVSSEGCVFTCKTNYNWTNGGCLAATQQGTCTGLPAYADWKGSATIQQTWNGTAWLPSTNGSYSETAVANECRFACNAHYIWDGEKCNAETNIASCGTLPNPGTTVWNTVSSITQRWNGSKFMPEATLIFSETPTTEECHYKCADNYEWDGAKCDGAVRNNQECTGKPANSVWWHATVNQKWQGSDGWLPSTNGTYRSGDATDGCYYHCDTNFEWNGSACVGATKTETTPCSQPDDPNAVLHNAGIIQTWTLTEDGTYDWRPATTPSYSATAVNNQCRYKCKDNYEWNGTSCEPKTQIRNCGLLVDENAVWNTVSSIKQTWNADKDDFEPSLTPEFCETASTERCCYKCVENFEPKAGENGQITCQPKTREASCTGLPANAEWIVDAEGTGAAELAITQNWDKQKNDWAPETAGTHGEYLYNSCHYKCKEEGEHYDYSGGACVAHTEYNVSCDITSKPIHATWWKQDINQTWNGTAMQPTNQGSYSSEDASNQNICSFYCDANYEWDGEDCVGATRYSDCEGLPANASWNTASNIKQTYDGDTYEPSLTAVYCENASVRNCCFKCNANYDLSDDQNSCKPASRTRDCTGLPANAEWNTGNSGGQVTQTWNGVEWRPALNGTYGETMNSEKCVFKCLENYEWKGGLCVAKKESALCKGLPANAVWNEVASIVREWQGSAWDVSTKGEYNEEPSKTECRFKCKENYNWDGSKCRAQTRFVECDPRPANSVWNEVATITQTWNGKDWSPKTTPEYSAAPSTTECKYICNTGFYPINGKCVANPCNIDGGNPCSGVEHSTGVCEIEDKNLLLPYSCECIPGYHWWGKTGCRQKAVNLGNVCTGLDSCYDEGIGTATEIPCPQEGERFYGQDAQYAEKGYCAPHKFAAKSTTVGAEIHRTVLDKNTELEWMYGTAGSGTWIEADNYCRGLNYAGHNDWRLPSVKELHTLVNYKYGHEIGFGFSSSLWTSTIDAAYPLDAFTWGGTNSSGAEIQYIWDESGDSYSVQEYARWICSENGDDCYWGSYVDEICPGNGEECHYESSKEAGFTCVRGSELPENDFEEIDMKGDGTEIVLKDLSTNLYWQKGYFESGWRQDLAYCENLTYGGYSDWRMPNINELISIVDYTVDYKNSLPTIDPRFDMPEFTYNSWAEIRGVSSTTRASGDNGWMYTVDFTKGHADFTWKGGLVHCVRSDLCDEGEFLFGKNCIKSPCREDSCDIENSDGICTPLSSSEFKCGCAAGYSWSASSESCLKDPCLDENLKNKCETMRGSDGICTRVGDTEFTCGCTEGYFWSVSSCRKKSALGSICTGQTRCYDNTHEITCPDKGEDFFGQDASYAAKGACVPKSFTNETISGNDVVIDNNTGLMWQKNVSDSDEYTFSQAISYCADLVYAGFGDWRLPNLKELYSIMEFGDKAPLDTDYFPAPSDWYYRMWSSVSNSGSTSDAYHVALYMAGQGYSSSTETSDKTMTMMVRCVRGSAMPENTLMTWTKNGMEILVDTESGLMYNPNFTVLKPWNEAISYCENSDYAGYTDWRLANINEIRTVADVYLNGYVNIGNSATSTTTYNDPNGFYLVHPKSLSAWTGKEDSNQFFCVRSGNVPVNVPVVDMTNMTCADIAECINRCENKDGYYDDDCFERCQNISMRDARYLFEDLRQCVWDSATMDYCDQQSSQSSYYQDDYRACVLSKCHNEFETCFANAGEGPHCVGRLDICYSSEKVDIKTNCKDIRQCVDSCGDDYNCQLACNYYSTETARDYYSMEARCRQDYCSDAEDLEACMQVYCDYEYEQCYGEFDKSCNELSGCISRCSGDDQEACEQLCRDNATLLGNARYDDVVQCINDNNCVYDDENPSAYNECLQANCFFEVRLCFSTGSKFYNCLDLNYCIDGCNGDQYCETECHDRATETAEIQYEDLLQCYENYNDFCVNEESPEDCLTRACWTEYATCSQQDPGDQPVDECAELSSDLDCIGIESCMARGCGDEEACLARATTEGASNFNARKQCRANCDENFAVDYVTYYNCYYVTCGEENAGCLGECSYSGTNLSCLEIANCSSSCTVEACINKAPAEESYKFIDYLGCINDCYQNDPSNYNICIETNCQDEAAACVGEQVILYQNCQEMTQCIQNCGSDDECPQQCYNDSNAAAKNQYSQLAICIRDNCSEVSTEEEYVECMTTNCPSEYAACYGN